jgi:hypothetical protein
MAALGFCAAFILITLVSVKLEMAQENQKAREEHLRQRQIEASRKPPIPGYRIVRQERAGGFVVMDVVLAEAGKVPAEEELRALLPHFYDEAKPASSGARISVYVNFEDHVQGLGNPVGVISKPMYEGSPSIDIFTHTLNALKEPSDIRFGMTEGKRMEVFQALVAAQHRAHAEAERM